MRTWRRAQALFVGSLDDGGTGGAATLHARMRPRSLTPPLPTHPPLPRLPLARPPLRRRRRCCRCCPARPPGAAQWRGAVRPQRRPLPAAEGGPLHSPAPVWVQEGRAGKLTVTVRAPGAQRAACPLRASHRARQPDPQQNPSSTQGAAPPPPPPPPPPPAGA